VPEATLPPRAEGSVPLPDGRALGFAEYGVPDGRLVVWHHGLPGGRRQIPPAARVAARDLGVRLVCLERPGIGESTNHLYGEIRDWAADVAVVADHFGAERFVVVGLSGGGPYALACGHELPDRVVAIGVLGGLVPTAGDDAAAAGVVALANRFNRILTTVRVPFGTALQGFLKVSNPLANQFYGAFARVMPEGDRKVFADPAIREMFIEDLTVGGARQFHAMPNDIVLVGRDWGFRLEDVQTPVRWWHGDADPFVGLDQAERTAARLPHCDFVVRPGESHLGGFAAADEMLEALVADWDAADAS
jgi:pimeloyl-ACP methyl ester carboxylesterase